MLGLVLFAIIIEICSSQSEPTSCLVCIHNLYMIYFIQTSLIKTHNRINIIYLDPTPSTRLVLSYQHINTGKCMYATDDGQLLAGDCCTGRFIDCDHQYWYLQDAPTEKSNDVMVVDLITRKCIFSNSDGRFGLTTCVRTNTDQY